MTQIVEAVFAARDRVLMLLILTVAVLLVTYIIYTISGRSGIVKYLPGFLLTAAGVYYMYRGLLQLTTHAGLNELMSAVIFVVIGLIGISFALILGILHQGEGQKTKRRAQALDYLQEARSAEPVVYPPRKPAEKGPADPEVLRAQEEQHRNEEAERKKAEEEQQQLLEQQRLEQKEKEEQERARQEALRQEREREEKRIAATHTSLLQQEEHRFAHERKELLAGLEQRQEEQKLARLERELANKNALREDVIAYNQKAEEVNQKEEAAWSDQIGLFFQRTGIQIKKWIASAGLGIQSRYSTAALNLSRRIQLATTAIIHKYRSFMTRFEAKKKTEASASDSKQDPTE